MKNKVLVFGAQGQLGKCIQDLKKNSNTNWVYADLSEVDITQHSETEKYITSINPNIIINCSAYTAVDNAEIEKNLAYKVNALAVENLAKLSKQIQAKFIHISTDYVFDGRKNTPYTEDEKTNPLNVYGASKLEGEILANKVNSDIAIIRTSWLYSEYGKNFAKTMLNLGKEKEEIKVIFDQTGTPCYAGDLAKAILKITDLYFNENTWLAGVYHFSNQGVCSWYDFAVQIMKIKNLNCRVLPITSDEFPSKTKRPNYSVLNKSKIQSNYNIDIPYWTDSLKICLDKL